MQDVHAEIRKKLPLLLQFASEFEEDQVHAGMWPMLAHQVCFLFNHSDGSMCYISIQGIRKVTPERRRSRVYNISQTTLVRPVTSAADRLLSGERSSKFECTCYLHTFLRF